MRDCLVYTAQQLADQRVTLFVKIYRQKSFCFSSAAWRWIYSIWLITFELANQRARKVLFTCVVWTKMKYFHNCFSVANRELKNRVQVRDGVELRLVFSSIQASYCYNPRFLFKLLFSFFSRTIGFIHVILKKSVFTRWQISRSCDEWISAIGKVASQFVCNFVEFCTF